MTRRHRYGARPPGSGPLRFLRLVVAAVVALAATLVLVALGDDDDDDDDDDRDDDDGLRAPSLVVELPFR